MLTAKRDLCFDLYHHWKFHYQIYWRFFPRGSQNLEFKGLLKKSSPCNSIIQASGECLPCTRRHRYAEMEEKKSHKIFTQITTKYKVDRADYTLMVQNMVSQARLTRFELWPSHLVVGDFISHLYFLCCISLSVK